MAVRCSKCRTRRAAIGPRLLRRFDGEWLVYICPECGHGKWLRPFDFKRRTEREVMKESIARLLDIGREN